MKHRYSIAMGLLVAMVGLGAAGCGDAGSDAGVGTGAAHDESREGGPSAPSEARSDLGTLDEPLTSDCRDRCQAEYLEELNQCLDASCVCFAEDDFRCCTAACDHRPCRRRVCPFPGQ